MLQQNYKGATIIHHCGYRARLHLTIRHGGSHQVNNIVALSCNTTHDNSITDCMENEPPS